MSKLNPRAVPACWPLRASPGRRPAQYMSLDTNGDGTIRDGEESN